MYPFPEGNPQAERVVIKYFGRGRDIGRDTQAKSGNIELFYVHVRLQSFYT